MQKQYEIYIGKQQPGNTFMGDSNAVALWSFESGALETDRLGSNTLTDVNTVTNNTTNYKEGGASADFEKDDSEYFYINDSSLNSNFPFKYGTTNKSGSICAWIRLESLPSPETGFVFVGKGDYNAGNNSFIAWLWNSSGTYFVGLSIGYNSGSSQEELIETVTLATSTWYHVTFSFDNTTKEAAIRIRDTNGDVVEDFTTTMTLDASGIYLNDLPFYVGAEMENGSAVAKFDGLIDELLVFNDALTSAEVTQIAQGIYG